MRSGETMRDIRRRGRGAGTMAEREVMDHTPLTTKDFRSTALAELERERLRRRTAAVADERRARRHRDGEILLGAEHDRVTGARARRAEHEPAVRGDVDVHEHVERGGHR